MMLTLQRSRWFVGTCDIKPAQDMRQILLQLYVKMKADFIEGQVQSPPQHETRILKFLVHLPAQQRISKFAHPQLNDAQIDVLTIDAVTAEEALPELVFEQQQHSEESWSHGTMPSIGRKCQNNATITKCSNQHHPDYDKIVDLAKANKLDEIPAKIFLDRYHQLRSIMKDYLKLPPDGNKGPCGLWVCGKTGTGKSKWVRSYFKRLGMKIYNKPANSKWFDGYQDQPVVLLDDFSKDSAKIVGSSIKIWSDEYASTVEIKGSSVSFKPKFLVITTQYDIEDIYKPQADRELYEAVCRRFKVINLPPEFRCTRIKGLRRRNSLNAALHNPFIAARVVAQRYNKVGVDFTSKLEKHVFPRAMIRHRDQLPGNSVDMSSKKPRWEPIPMTFERQYLDWDDDYRSNRKLDKKQKSRKQRQQRNQQNDQQQQQHQHHHQYNYHNHFHFHSHFHANNNFGIHETPWGDRDAARKTKLLEQEFAVREWPLEEGSQSRSHGGTI